MKNAENILFAELNSRYDKWSWKKKRFIRIIKILIFTLICVVSAPAMASHTMCYFSTKEKADNYYLEFIGNGKIATVQASQGTGYLKVGKVKVNEFEFKKRRIDLIHTSTNEKEALPSLTLKGSGKNVIMKIGNKSYKGELECGGLGYG